MQQVFFLKLPYFRIFFLNDRVFSQKLAFFTFIIQIIRSSALTKNKLSDEIDY